MHTSMMAHIINKAPIQQRSVVINLLDLENSFSEVHHNSTSKVFSCHHIPQKAQVLLSSLYNKFHTSIVTDVYTTPAISVRIGVLQGHCFSPLLFNM